MLYIQIDAICIVVLLMLLYSRQSPGVSPTDQQLFGFMFMADILAFFIDLGSWLIIGATFPGAVYCSWLLNSAFFLITPLLGVIWLIYVDYQVFGDEAGLRKRMLYYLIPFFLYTVALLLNPIYRFLFWVDDGVVYHRGTYFYIQIVICFGYMLYASALSLWKMRRVSPSRKSEYRWIGMFILPPLVASLLQGCFYGLSLVLPGTMISLLMVYISRQNRLIRLDGLTGCNNRRRLEQYLEENAAAFTGSNSAFLLMLDVDGFKRINDTCGHSAGDAALKAVADTLKRVCGENNCFLARIGGDEFVIVGKAGDGQEVMAGVHRLLAEKKDTGLPWAVTVSVGCARFGETGGDVKKATALADARMYEEKNRKKAGLQYPKGLGGTR